MTSLMLKSKTIIVTGAGSGIGRVSAETFARAGANVVVADLNEIMATETAALIKNAGGEAIACRCNVADEADVAALIAFTVDRYGRIDGAHNNAGIEPRSKPLHELTARDWQQVLDVDLTGVFYCVKHEFLAMKQTGGGSIVNTSSAAGVRANANAAEYVSAKFGVIGLTKAAAIEGGPLGIRVNAVCPGVILTPMTKDRLFNNPLFAEALEGMTRRHVIGRLGQPEEVANAVMWLLSDLSSFQTGTDMLVDGGYSI